MSLQTELQSGLSASARTISLENLPRYNLDCILSSDNGPGESIAKGGVTVPFPWRLHECLDAVEREGLSHIISWQPHGRAFTVLQPKRFVELVMPRFFNQSKYASFQRQLNMYGFSRFSQGKDKGAYFHLCFVRGHRSLVRNMIRRKLKNKHEFKPLVEDHDFYHSAWTNHFEASVPVELRGQSRSASVTMINSQCIERQETSSPVTSTAADLVGRNIVIPSPTVNVPCVPEPSSLSDTSLVSVREDVMGAIADASVISDDLSLPWDASLSGKEDRDVALFEGSRFHLVENPFAAADALEPLPIMKTPCRCCQCHCSGNVTMKDSINNNTIDETSMVDLMDPLLVDGLLSL